MHGNASGEAVSPLRRKKSSRVPRRTGRLEDPILVGVCAMDKKVCMHGLQLLVEQRAAFLAARYRKWLHQNAVHTPCILHFRLCACAARCAVPGPAASN